MTVANFGGGGDNRSMPANSCRENASSNRNTPGSVPVSSGPFSPGAMVVVTLGNPRDKFWGMILSLATEGLSITGIELASFEDLVVMVKEGEPLSPGVVFFPMHRNERIELDLPDTCLPSLSQRFSAKTGLDAAILSSRGGSDSIGQPADPASSRIPATKDPA